MFNSRCGALAEQLVTYILCALLTTAVVIAKPTIDWPEIDELTEEVTRALIGMP